MKPREPEPLAASELRRVPRRDFPSRPRLEAEVSLPLSRTTRRRRLHRIDGALDDEAPCAPGTHFSGRGPEAARPLIPRLPRLGHLARLCALRTRCPVRSPKLRLFGRAVSRRGIRAARPKRRLPAVDRSVRAARDAVRRLQDALAPRWSAHRTPPVYGCSDGRTSPSRCRFRSIWPRTSRRYRPPASAPTPCRA